MFIGFSPLTPIAVKSQLIESTTTDGAEASYHTGLVAEPFGEAVILKEHGTPEVIWQNSTSGAIGRFGFLIQLKFLVTEFGQFLVSA